MKRKAINSSSLGSSEIVYLLWGNDPGSKVNAYLSPTLSWVPVAFMNKNLNKQEVCSQPSNSLFNLALVIAVKISMI